jgi:hypothetical protein
MRASRGGGMSPGAMALAVASGGLGFVLADGLDRLLATYDPGGVKPTDKFTSDGTGTLANTLNIAAMPNWKRAVAGVGVAAVPAVGAMFVKNSYGRGALEGLAVGAGISAFKTLWQNVLMPMLVGKDTSAPTLQKSYIARLYPAEVAAHVSRASQPKGAAPGNAAGVLSGAPDVGPFALAGDSPYPDAGEALRTSTGVHGDSPYPDAAQSLRAATGVHGDSPYPSTAQALGYVGADGSWNPGPPPGVGPGPQAKPHADCGCVGDLNPYLGFVGDAPGEETPYPGLSN